MLATKPTQSSSIRRSAFTLVEVMVVMAIIIILASLATVGTMKYMQNAKDMADEAGAMAIVNAYRTEYLKRGEQWPEDPSEIASYLEKGSQGLMNPWGMQYTVAIMDTESGPRPFVTSGRADGQSFTYPKR